MTPSLMSTLNAMSVSSSLDENPTPTQLRLRANELFPTDPAAAITLYTQALSLAPHDAPILANRSAAYLKIQKWPEAYQDACQALDESGRVTGMDGELRVKCVVRAGEACIGAEVWDIAVIHLDEASQLLDSPRIRSLRTKALNSLLIVTKKRTEAAAMEQRKRLFLEAAFPRLGHENVGDEWESDEDGSDEEDGSEGEDAEMEDAERS